MNVHDPKISLKDRSGARVPTLCAAVVDTIVTGKAHSISKAAIYLVGLESFSHLQLDSIKVMFSMYATPAQKEIVAKYSRTMTSDIGIFTTMLDEQHLINSVSDAWRIWQALGISANHHNKRSFLNSFKRVCDPLENRTDQPKGLLSFKISDAISALRLLKARAEHQHP